MNRWVNNWIVILMYLYRVMEPHAAIKKSTPLMHRTAQLNLKNMKWKKPDIKVHPMWFNWHDALEQAEQQGKKVMGGQGPGERV